MNNQEMRVVMDIISRVGKSHPWHGVPIGPEAPRVVTTYIEIVPGDTVKYELDKLTGHLKVDRPQRYSNVCPTLYGLIPRTYCGDTVAQRCMEKTGRTGISGDNDPVDICILSEKTIMHGDILMEARPIGGLRMIDDQEADEKIIAVMKGDALYEYFQDIHECPIALVERLKHYFLTYKDAPGSEHRQCEIVEVYGREEAHEVIRLSQEDYRINFPSLEGLIAVSVGNS